MRATAYTLAFIAETASGIAIGLFILVALGWVR